MPTHLTYEDALSQDPQMSRLLMAIQTAGSSTESPSHQGPALETSPGSQLPHSHTGSAHRTRPITVTPSIQVGHPLPPPPTGLPNGAPPIVPVPRPSGIPHTEYRSPGTPPVNPKSYASSSDDGFSDGEIDHLINLFEDLTTDPPSPPPQVPGTPLVEPTKVYLVSSNRQTGMYDRWADAGHLSQGVPTAHVRKVVDRTLPKYPSYEAYVVFEGLAPGIYRRWREVDPLVTGIPGNVHKGFVSRLEAERAYVLAYAMGALRTLPRRGSSTLGPPPATPTPQEVMDAFASLSDDFLGAEWYVVYKGKRPGLYPTWNFAASQILNVGCAIHDKFSSKALAEEAWVHALTEPGRVQVLN